jgi:transketolase
MRKNFYKYLTSLFKNDNRTVILLGDIGVFSLKSAFDHDSSRAYNLGIMEQSMIGAACGLSKSGFIPFVHSIAPFITERSYEQLKLNFGYENVNSFVISVGNSYDYAGLGCTHHCPNDLRIVSSIPNFKTYCPGNSGDVEEIISKNLNVQSPKYVRLSEVENNLRSLSSSYEDLSVLHNNQNGICILIGNSIKDVAKLINSNPNYTIVYSYNISEFDVEKLKSIIENNNISKKITVVEPCSDSGIISKIATSIKNIDFIESISVPKIFIEKYGKKENIDNYLKLDDKSITEKLSKIYEC